MFAYQPIMKENQLSDHEQNSFNSRHEWRLGGRHIQFWWLPLKITPFSWRNSIKNLSDPYCGWLRIPAPKNGWIPGSLTGGLSMFIPLSRIQVGAAGPLKRSAPPSEMWSCPSRETQPQFFGWFEEMLTGNEKKTWKTMVFDHLMWILPIEKMKSIRSGLVHGFKHEP